MDLIKELDKSSEVLEEDNVITEGRVRIEVMMILDEVIRDKAITNGAQESVIATIIGQLRDGRYSKVTNAFERYTPSGDISEALSHLESDDVASLAAALKVMMMNIEAIDMSNLDANATVVDWINYVLAKQD